MNNFSAAGGNTAVLLEEGPKRIVSADQKDPRQDHVVCVSAKTKSALLNNIKNLVEYLDQHSEASVSDVSYTTTARRIQYPIRVSVNASSTTQLRERLAAELKNEDRKPAEKSSGIIFTFTGQGALYTSLGKELYDTHSQFRFDIDHLNDITNSHGFTSFLPVINGKANNLDELTPVQTQLAITAVQIALCRLWNGFGLEATAVIGHSLGEYAALYAAGILSLSDALYLVGIRASLLESKCGLGTHAMLAIHATAEAVKNALGAKFNDLEVACINGPEDIVLSGLANAVAEADQQLKSRNIKCTILNVPFAFHSSQVDPILEPYTDAARAIQFRTPRIPLISPLLSSIVRTDGVINPSYLARHAREAVNFCGALQQSEAEGLSDSQSIWLEIGPHPICLGMIKSTLGVKIRGTGSLRNNEKPWTTGSKALSFLYQAGLNLNWSEYHRGLEQGLRLLALPSYAFDEKNYWIEYKNNWVLNKSGVSQAPSVESWSGATTTVQRLVSTEKKGDKISLIFETNLSDPAMHSAITGHLVNGVGLCPAVRFLPSKSLIFEKFLNYGSPCMLIWHLRWPITFAPSTR